MQTLSAGNVHFPDISVRPRTKLMFFFSNRPVIRDTLSKTNLMVMIDDPVISTNLAELLLQVQSGLTMGSRNAGMATPGGSLLLTSNSTVTQR